MLLSHELVQREQRKTNRLEKQARFRLTGQVEQLDYRAGRGVSQAQIRQLLEGHWLSHQQNLLLTARQAVARVTWRVPWAVTLSGKEWACGITG